MTQFSTLGFPQINSPFTDPESGRITRPWLDLLKRVWVEVGGLLTIEDMAELGLFGNAPIPTNYADGEWTPFWFGSTTAGTPTHDLQEGTWEQVGRLIVARFFVEGTSTTGMVGELRVGGLPRFSTAKVNDFGSFIFTNAGGFTFPAGTTQITGSVDQSANVFRPVRVAGLTGSGVAVTIADISNPAAYSMRGTIIYRAA